jgi:hypothetical protein
MPAERAERVLGASRELPNGRGFLRAVSDAAPKAPPGQGRPFPPSPETPPALAIVEPNVDVNGQLDLLAWQPHPAKLLSLPGTQLDLFGSKPEQ